MNTVFGLGIQTDVLFLHPTDEIVQQRIKEFGWQISHYGTRKTMNDVLHYTVLVSVVGQPAVPNSPRLKLTNVEV